MLFETQAKADSMLSRLALTLRCSRASLNVCASPRSVVLGPLDLIGKEHTSKCYHTEQLIPDASELIQVHTSASWALVVEKHAMFQTLQSCNFLHHAATHGIPGVGLLITVGILTNEKGKGYPDHAVRSLLRLLGNSYKYVHVSYAVLKSSFSWTQVRARSLTWTPMVLTLRGML